MGEADEPVLEFGALLGLECQTKQQSIELCLHFIHYASPTRAHNLHGIENRLDSPFVQRGQTAG